MIHKYNPELLYSPEGKLVLQISLGAHKAILPVPAHLTKGEQGYQDFIDLAVKEMMAGLKERYDLTERAKRRKAKNAAKKL